MATEEDLGPRLSARLTYRLKRALTPGGPYEDIASGLGSPRYEMPLRAGGAPFHCVITAMNAGGESQPSAPVFVVPPPALAPSVPMPAVTSFPRAGERLAPAGRLGAVAGAEARGGARNPSGPVVFTCPASPRRGRVKLSDVLPGAVSVR